MTSTVMRGTKLSSRNYINTKQWEWGDPEENMQINSKVSDLLIECTFADFYRWISQEQSYWQTAKPDENKRKYPLLEQKEKELVGKNLILHSTFPGQTYWS